MKSTNLSRRAALKTGVFFSAATGITAAFAAPRKPGEVRVLYHGGDYYHNGVTQEQSWRRVLAPAGWTLLFAQTSDVLTDELLSDVDLFILCRYATDTQADNISLGFSPEKIVNDRTAPPVFMKDETEDAIVKNVRRGMGLVSMHCSIWNGKKKKFMDLLGVETPVMHGPVVQTQIVSLNDTHPISQGIKPFGIGIDEAFDAVMKHGRFEQLFRLKQDTPARDAIGGWVREEGKGRVVALLPGHTTDPYQQKSFKDIMWRSAWWALRRDIPSAPHLKSGY
jgi:type 1 glutamine amidotransferase